MWRTEDGDIESAPSGSDQWGTIAISTALLNRIPSQDLPAGEALVTLLARAAEKDLTAVMHVYRGYLRQLVPRFARRSKGRGRAYLCHLLECAALFLADALVHYQADRDGDLLRFLELSVAAGYTEALAAWPRLKPFADQARDAEIADRIGTVEPDWDTVCTLRDRTYIDPYTIQHAWRILNSRYVRYAEDTTPAIPTDRTEDYTERLGQAPDAPTPVFNFVPPDEAVANKEVARLIRCALATLTPRAEKVLRMRFGIGYAFAHTLEETGAAIGKSKTHVSEIEAAALRDLRHPRRSNRLRSAAFGWIKPDATQDAWDELHELRRSIERARQELKWFPAYELHYQAMKEKNDLLEEIRQMEADVRNLHYRYHFPHT